MRELYCNDCGQKLGDPVKSNIENHKATTGHTDIIDRELIYDDGTPSTQVSKNNENIAKGASTAPAAENLSPAGQPVADETKAIMEKEAIEDAKEMAKNAKDSTTKKEAKAFVKNHSGKSKSY